jgi:primosomal protein N'
MEMASLVAQVIVDVSVDRAFDYRIPDDLRDQVRVGTRVSVPFGHRNTQGYVIEITDKALSSRPLKWSVVQRWLPLAASLVLGVAVIAQSSLSVGPQGWSLSFGSQSQGLTAAQLDEVLTAFAESQQLQTRQWVESALQTHAESSADSVYQWMTYMEQQRASDVQRMESGFEQLLTRDFQTVDSVRQLASYVMYQVTP